MDELIIKVKKGIEIELNEAKIMYSMTKLDKYKNELILQTALQKWFISINNYDDFKNKFNAFMELCNIRKLVDLFFQIMRINNIKRDAIDELLIKEGIYVIDGSDKYKEIVKSVEESFFDKNKYINVDLLIDEYNKIINDSEYKRLSKQAGWGLTNHFSEKENYINSNLYLKVYFFNIFKSRLSILENQLETSVISDYNNEEMEETLSGKSK